MALAHNLLIRYLNSIYLQATGISKTKDVTDFLFYCQSWCSVIHEHHAGEEKPLFPRIEKLTGETDIMEESVEEHKAFSAGIDEFERCVRDTSAEEFDGQKLRSLIDAFAPALLKHLRAEVSTLVTIGERYGGDKLHAIFDAFETEIMKESRATWDPVSSYRPGNGYLLTGVQSMSLFLQG
jgi:hemerythrin-like domain-containing protein